MSGTTEKKSENLVTLELKICERCGGLWLRPSASRWIYCSSCKQKVTELPKTVPSPGRKKRQGKVGNFGDAGSAQVFVRTERVQ